MPKEYWEISPEELEGLEEWDECDRCGSLSRCGGMEYREIGPMDPETGYRPSKVVCPRCQKEESEDNHSDEVDILDVWKSEQEENECPF